MASSYISRTFGTPTDEDKWTLSFWYKKCSPTATARVLDADGGGNEGNISFDHTTGKLNFYQYPGGTQLITSNYYRDVGAFYHVVVIFDAANGTASDRAQIWVNGERVTTLGTASYPTTLYSRINKSGVVHYIGAKGSTSSMYCDGVFSHMNFVDGSALAPSYFGETDSTSGIWKIKTSPSVTYGNNGFFLKFEDRTNLDLDSSPNAHTFTTTGTITPTYDNPSNNFATMNPNMGAFGSAYGFTLTNGNLKVATTSSNDCGIPATFAMEGGKWYWEVKCDYMPSTQSGCLGIVNTDKNWGNASTGTGDPYGFVYVSNGQKKRDGTAESYGDSWGPASSGGDIIGVAFDVDNRKLYFSKNGTWQDSGDPTSGATGTGAAYTIPTGRIYMPYACERASGYSFECSFNFGNGYFGTTAVSSTNADDAGIGSFEYDVPAGYYALCTKNIKAYGG